VKSGVRQTGQSLDEHRRILQLRATKQPGQSDDWLRIAQCIEAQDRLR
jgi:hypothetical protein